MSSLSWTLIIGFLMFVSYITAKIPYGLTAVLCCLALEITGVLSASEAWIGFGNTTVFLFASVFILGAGLMKTSFIPWLHKIVRKYGHREGVVRWFCMILSAFLSVLTSATASGATMLPMVNSLCKGNKEIHKSRILKPVMDVGCIAFAIMPFGMGAAFIEQGNSYLMEMGSGSHMSIFSSLIARGPILVITILFLGFFGFRLLPAVTSAENIDEESDSENTESSLSPFSNLMGIIIFFASIIMMIISALLDIPSHYAPIIGSVLMVACGVLTGKEAFSSIDLNTVCIYAGSLSFATALSKTGVADWIADILTILTANSLSEHLLVAVFILVPFIMTQFMGNIPVINLTMPIAAIVSANTGINPVAIMVATVAGATLSITTPMAAGVQALIMDPGSYKFKDYLKSGIPTAIVYIVCYVLWAPIVFPLY